MKTLALLLSIFLSGCAAPVIKVNLAYNEAAGSYSSVIVRDGRLDKQIYMNGISFGSASHIYLLEANPPIEEVVQRIVCDHLQKAKISLPEVRITIEELELKNKVGFMKADELYCKIESKIRIVKKPDKFLTQTVKTFSYNDKNMSPLVKTSAKVILDQCLHQHGVDLANKLLKQD